MGKFWEIFKRLKWYQLLVAFVLFLLGGSGVLWSLHDVGTDPPPTPFERESEAVSATEEPCINREISDPTFTETYFVKVPCDRVPNIEEQSGGAITYSGNGGGEVEIELFLFENNANLPITGSEIRLNGNLITPPLVIGENDYQYDPGISTDMCYAKVQVTVGFQGNVSATNNYNLVFNIRDHGRTLHGGNAIKAFFDRYFGGNEIARCRSAYGNNSLEYYRCLDGSTDHISHHVHIMDLDVCIPDVEKQ